MAVYDLSNINKVLGNMSTGQQTPLTNSTSQLMQDIKSFKAPTVPQPKETYGTRVSNNLIGYAGYDASEPVSEAERKKRRLQGLRKLSDKMSIRAAYLTGDPRQIALAQEREKAMQTTPKAGSSKRLSVIDPKTRQPIAIATAEARGYIVAPLTGPSTSSAVSSERFGVYDPTTKTLIGTVLKIDTQKISQLETQGKVVGALRSPTVGGKSAVSDPLRTVTVGGKVDYNIRDSKLTDEKIQEINKAGAVIQPLGFTEKFESSKDVDFSPIKSKYLATQNIIIKASELADKFVSEPSSALAVGTAAQFIDGVIQNIDAGVNLLSNAKDTKVYKYIQDTSTSLEGKDFSDLIQKASEASGVSGSRIRDLAYLFAAARGQEGRGLSDKDYENALRIVAGGVGASGRSAVLKDVSNSLRDEFYRDINFDIATSENEAYVNKLKELPELPYYVDPFIQQPIPTTQTTDGIPRVRIKL